LYNGIFKNSFCIKTYHRGIGHHKVKHGMLLRAALAVLVLGASVAAHAPSGSSRCAAAFLPSLPMPGMDRHGSHAAAALSRARSLLRAVPGGARARGTELRAAADPGGASGGGCGGGGRGRGGRGDGGGRGDDGGEQRPGRAPLPAGLAAVDLMSRREVLAAVAATVALLGLAPAATARMASVQWAGQPFSAEDIPDLWASETVRRAIVVSGALAGVVPVLLCHVLPLPHADV